MPTPVATAKVKDTKPILDESATKESFIGPSRHGQSKFSVDVIISVFSRSDIGIVGEFF